MDIIKRHSSSLMSMSSESTTVFIGTNVSQIGVGTNVSQIDVVGR